MENTGKSIAPSCIEVADMSSLDESPRATSYDAAKIFPIHCNRRPGRNTTEVLANK